MFWIIFAVVIVSLVVWSALQDCDLNLKFWCFFGASEDRVLHRKVAFITGAGSGIGKALALRWASKSVRLALNDFNNAALEEVRAECISLGAKDDDLLLLPGDVAEESNHVEWINAILGKYTEMDILVNNAGRLVLGLFDQLQFSMHKGLFDVNVTAPVGLTKAALSHFLGRRTGYIVQVSSVAARFSIPMCASYAASKAAVLILILRVLGVHGEWLICGKSHFGSLRMEVLKDGVSVTVVCPGPVQTSLVPNSLQVFGVEASTGIMEKLFDLSQPGKLPKVIHGVMSTTRCAELISKAMVNRIGEAWISSQPTLLFAQIYSWAPSITSWFLAAVVVPLIVRFSPAMDRPGARTEQQTKADKEQD